MPAHSIDELNTVRKQLSAIKGGHLAHCCTARRVIVLVISDVPGDPLDVIASGPTVADTSTADDALAVLARYRAVEAGISPAIFAALEKRRGMRPEPIRCQVSHVIVGNNAMAVDAAGLEAERRGYSHAMTCSTKPEGPAEDIGRHLAEMALAMRAKAGPDCLISGGEPTVRLVAADRRGLGGRNQQLVLAAAERLQAAGNPEGIVILSGGTDGEDGPTDAAGALGRCAVDSGSSAAKTRSGRVPGSQRRLPLVRTARRTHQDWPNAHQRQRLASCGSRSRSRTMTLAGRASTRLHNEAPGACASG